MNFPYRLPTALIGAAATIVMVQPQVVALTAEQVNNIAKEITVLVREPNNSNQSGSGVIIGRDYNTNTYYVLTANHIVKDEVEYQIVTSDGKQHLASDSNIIRTTRFDLAILQFKSDQNYKVATLINYDLSNQFWHDTTPSNTNSGTPPNNHDWSNSIGAYSRNIIFVSGYFKDKNTQTIHSVSPGFLWNNDSAVVLSQEPLELGYELLYTNITTSGFSGGPVLDTNGRVIGIHGRSDGRADVQLGYSLGIPIYNIYQIVPQSITQKLKIENTLPTPLSQQEISSIQAFFKQVEVATGGPSGSDWLNRGNQLYRLGRYQAAIECFDKAIQLLPNSYQAWFSKGLVLSRSSQYQAAIEPLEKATQLKPDFYPAWFWLGLEKYNLGKYQEAIADYDKAIQIRPNLYQALRYRGDALQSLQRYEEALTNYNQVIQLKPNYHEAWFYRGVVLGYLANKEEAAKLYDQALGRYLDALQSTDQAINIRPDFSYSWHNRAGIINKLQEYPYEQYGQKILESLGSLQKYASNEQKQKIQTELNRLQQYTSPQDKIKFLVESKQKHLSMFLEESVASSDEALKYKQDDPGIWYKKGWALNQLQRYDEALVCFE